MPAVVSPEIVVVGEVGAVIIVVVGLTAAAVHVPAPVAAMLTIPELLQIVWSGPALGLAVTITNAVSLQLLDVQVYLYVPAVVNPLIEVVGDVVLAITVVAGFPARAAQTPVPVAAIVAVLFWQMVSSGPALGFEVTYTFMLSTHRVSEVHMKIYLPEVLNPVIDVVFEVGVTIVVVAGLLADAVHVPTPVD